MSRSMPYSLFLHDRVRLLGVFVLLVVLLGAAWWALHVVNSDPLRSPPAELLGVSVHGASALGTKFSASGDEHQGPAIVAAKLSLEPNAHYIASIEVLSAPRAPAEVQIDLFAPGYDEPSQEASFVLDPSDQYRRVHVRLGAGSAPPPEAELRIMHGGTAGLTLGGIRVSRLPAWRLFLETAIGVMALLIAACWVFQLGAMYAAQEAESVRAPGMAIEIGGLAAMILVAMAARWALSSLVPYWSGDEVVYKAIASGIWVNGKGGIPSPDQVAHLTNLPNMLYPYVIAPAFAFGGGFHDALRLINALAWALAILPVYFIARRFLSRPLSFFSAAAAVALPSGFLAAFVVTEPLYYPLFLAAVLVGLRSIEESGSWRRAIGFGLVLGVLLNVRLNGIVLVPAWLLAFAGVTLAVPGTRKLRAMSTAAASVVSMAASYYAIKLTLAAPDAVGLGLYENRSGGWVSTAVSVAIADPHGVAQLVLGHLTILAIPFALGIAGAMNLLRYGSTDHRRSSAAFLMLVSAGCVAFAVVFTLGVSPVDLGGLGRWHSRYYFSVFPLLIILALAGYCAVPPGRRPRFLAVGVVMAFLLAMVLFVLVYESSSNPWFGATVDSMEVHWMRFWRWPLIGLSAGIAASAMLWGRRAGTGVAAATLMAWLVVANLGTLKTLQAMPTRLDPRCGKVMQSAFGLVSEETAIVVSERRFLVDNLFWISGIPIRSLVLEPDQTFDAATLHDASYLLTDPAVRVANASLVSAIGQCNLYKVN